MTATQLFNKRQQERNATRAMEDEARRLEEQAALQAQRRQDEMDADADAAAEIETQLADAELADKKKEAEEADGGDEDGEEEDPIAVAMRRKVGREREAAARQIQRAAHARKNRSG